MLNLLVWVALRLYMHDPASPDGQLVNCPFFAKTSVDFYLCELPLFAILFFNTFFLIWIMVVSIKSLLKHFSLHFLSTQLLSLTI